MNQITSEIGQLRQQLSMYKEMYEQAILNVESLERKLIIEETINDQYRAFFMKNLEYCHWMRDHNAQFNAFKSSPYYIKSFPQVDRFKQLE